MLLLAAAAAAAAAAIIRANQNYRHVDHNDQSIAEIAGHIRIDFSRVRRSLASVLNKPPHPMLGEVLTRTTKGRRIFGDFRPSLGGPKIIKNH